MYLPRNLLSHLYTHLVRNTHPLSPPVLILVSLDPDAICACRILTALLKRDYIPHKVQPVAGYSELSNAGRELVLPLTRQHGGDGGIVVCLGVGGLVDLEEVLGLDGINGEEEQVDMQQHGVEVWVVDARRPWNLQNVFASGSLKLEERDAESHVVKRKRGVDQGKLLPSYAPGKGGIIVFDDGDIERELLAERDAFCALQDMPELGEDNEDDDAPDSDDEDGGNIDESGAEDDASDEKSRKRKSSSEMDEDEVSDDERPYQRRRSNSGSSIPSSPRERRERLEFSNHPTSSQQSAPVPSSPPANSRQPSARTLRRRLLRLRRKHEAVLQSYYSLGTSYSEPMSSMLYSLASELGREDNDLLWLAIIGVSAVELYGNAATFTSSDASKQVGWSANRHEQIRDVMRDEVRRLNPIPTSDIARDRDMGESGGVIPTHARSPTDTSIRLSPEPRFLLIRHWSLYESMLHSPYLSTRLHIWSEPGKKRLHKFLAKMGVSLA